MQCGVHVSLHCVREAAILYRASCFYTLKLRLTAHQVARDKCVAET